MVVVSTILRGNSAILIVSTILRGDVAVYSTVRNCSTPSSSCLMNCTRTASFGFIDETVPASTTLGEFGDSNNL